MKLFRLIVLLALIASLVPDESDARGRSRRRRRSRSKIYSAPSKFELSNRRAFVEVKSDKLILTTDKGRTEEPIPFQTKQDKVAGIAYIPMGGRDFVQMIVWVVDVKGNIGPSAKVEAPGEEAGQLLYWELYEIVENKIIWRQQQLLDQFLGQASKELPAHLENAIQLALDESGKVYFKRGAVEEVVASD